MTLLTNCLNCGAPLSSDGCCSYCNTKVRYANELEYNLFSHGNIKDVLPTEIMFKFIDEDGTMVIIPFIGKPESIEIIYNDHDAIDRTGNIMYKINRQPMVKFDFTGCIGEMPKAPTVSRR